MHVAADTKPVSDHPGPHSQSHSLTMGLAGAGVPDQAQRLALLDPLALGQGVDDRGIDAGVGLEVEAA